MSSDSSASFPDLPVDTMMSESVADALLVVLPLIGFATAIFYFYQVSRVKLTRSKSSPETGLIVNNVPDGVFRKVAEITQVIEDGAKAFLNAEYRILAVFIVLFGTLVFIALGVTNKDINYSPAPNAWANAAFTTLSFVVGCLTSILSGYIGMRVAVYGNGRTALKAVEGYEKSFDTAFKAGGVMGFALTSMAVLVLFILIQVVRQYYLGTNASEFIYFSHMWESIAGYGLGGSSIALFGRVGGGIYTKAADVGADLVGKVEQGIPEDDPRNPAVIADNVGDNVGDIAGMGADLFGSFAESTCAALVVAGNTPLATSMAAMMFPLAISAFGILVGVITSFVQAFNPVRRKEQIERALKIQLGVSTLLMTPLLFLLAYTMLPHKFYLPLPSSYHPIVLHGQLSDDVKAMSIVEWWHVFVCSACGLWSGLIIGFYTEYMTSHSYRPVRELAESCQTGAATNVIYGLALGYKSTIVPAACMAITIYVSLTLCGMFGIACAALGILSTLSTGLTIDAYGPISDNAGGIAEMSGLGEDVRERTDALDAAGNTTAAIGKGFAIGSAALVSLALFGAFTVSAGLDNIDILKPFEFAGLLIGAMLPYWFSAMTVRSVGTAASRVVQETRRQFAEIPGLMAGTATPDYAKCIKISTDASLREMIAPGVLVLGSPIVVGVLFGTQALSGMLAGSLVSAVHMAVSASNTGGAWDNAKKFIESGQLGGKGSEAHHAAVVGDTVGDPLKDTSGPAENVLMKLMAVESLVLAPFFNKIRDGKGLVDYLSKNSSTSS